MLPNEVRKRERDERTSIRRVHVHGTHTRRSPINYRDISRRAAARLRLPMRMHPDATLARCIHAGSAQPARNANETASCFKAADRKLARNVESLVETSNIAGTLRHRLRAVNARR